MAHHDFSWIGRAENSLWLQSSCDLTWTCSAPWIRIKSSGWLELSQLLVITSHCHHVQCVTCMAQIQVNINFFTHCLIGNIRDWNNLCSCKPVKGVTGQCNLLKPAQLHRSCPLTLNCLISQSGPWKNNNRQSTFLETLDQANTKD